MKLTVTQLINKFPTFYAARSFITVFTTARHCLLNHEPDSSSSYLPTLRTQDTF